MTPPRDRVHEARAWALWSHWMAARGITDPTLTNHPPPSDLDWLRRTLTWCPADVIRGCMDMAVARGRTNSLAYVNSSVQQWRDESTSTPPPTALLATDAPLEIHHRCNAAACAVREVRIRVAQGGALRLSARCPLCGVPMTAI
jgi:hypothetical protein